MCEHLSRLMSPRALPVKPSAEGCEDCLRTGGRWVHLRLCMTCGHVGCCDSSPSRHATRHFRASCHPVVKSFEPGESWAWCYLDQDILERILAFPVESPEEHYAPSP